MKTYSGSLSNSEEHLFTFNKESLKWLRPDNIKKMRIEIIDNTQKKYYSKYEIFPGKWKVDSIGFYDSTMWADL